MEWLPESCPGLTVDIHSIAGIATSVCVKRQKELNIMFDVGQHVNLPGGIVSHVFISHGHLDHIGAMFSLARMHGFGPKHPTFYVPEVCMEPVMKAKEAFEALDGSPLKLPVVAIKAGMEINVGSTYRVEAIRTVHRVPSVGYALHHLVTRVKPEYERLSGPERGMLARSGITLTERQWRCELVYTGDTRIEGVLTNPVCFQADILITEATFLGGRGSRDTVENARDKGHIHLDEIVANREAFETAPVQRIILCHFSQRYSRRDIIETVHAKLSPAMRSKVGLALQSFGGGNVYLGDLTGEGYRGGAGASSSNNNNNAQLIRRGHAAPKSAPGAPCSFFARHGRCSYGDKCLRSHDNSSLNTYTSHDLNNDGRPRSAYSLASASNQARKPKKVKTGGNGSSVDIFKSKNKAALSPANSVTSSTSMNRSQTGGICKFWRKSAGCQFGNSCRNKHDGPGRSQGGAGTAATGAKGNGKAARKAKPGGGGGGGQYANGGVDASRDNGRIDSSEMVMEMSNGADAISFKREASFCMESSGGMLSPNSRMQTFAAFAPTETYE